MTTIVRIIRICREFQISRQVIEITRNTTMPLRAIARTEASLGDVFEVAAQGFGNMRADIRVSVASSATTITTNSVIGEVCLV